jgi:hypothetical protein
MSKQEELGELLWGRRIVIRVFVILEWGMAGRTKKQH